MPDLKALLATYDSSADSSGHLEVLDLMRGGRLLRQLRHFAYLTSHSLLSDYCCED